MIAPARLLPRRPVLSRLASGALALGLLGLTAACDKVPLTAPTNSTITLFTNTTIVPVNGTADITATVVESGGTLVQNGTLVTFSTTIGQIDPAEARTRDGKVTVRLLAGSRSGRAIVTAFSGGARSDPDLAVDIGGAAAGRISLSANPTVVPASGGTSQLLAVVFDIDGNRLPGVPVSFTTTAGSITSAVVTTNAQGEAATSITTNRDADVTASAGGASGGGGSDGGGVIAAVTATVKITAAAAPAVSITAQGTPSADAPTTFSITATPVAPAVIRSITVDFGDGSTPQTLGNTTSVAHTYRSGGTFTVTATAEDSNGSRGSGSTIIVVAPSAPILVTLTATPGTAAVGAIITFRADLTQNPNNIAVDSVTWDFGDGNVRPGTGLTTTHAYGSSNTFLARVTIRFVNGRTSFGEAAVRIN